MNDVAPPIVFVHGIATPSARTWTEAGWVELFGEMGRAVHCIDLPGHGTTPPLDAPEAYADLGSWLADALPPGPVDAIGFSLGARLLLDVAAHQPDRFRRLVVAGVGGRLLQPDPERGRRIAAALAGDPHPDDPMALYFARLADHDDVDTDALAKIMSAGSALTEDLLAGATVPTLVVLGDHDDAGPLDPLVAVLPDVCGISLRNVDHFITPKAIGFLDAAIDFLL